MSVLAAPFGIVRSNLRAYLVLNAAVYGTFVVGMILGLALPGLYAWRTEAFVQSGSAELVNTVVRTPWLFGVTIFLVNVLPTSGLLIVLPSLVVPFGGLAVFAFKTLDLGISLAPVDESAALTLIPHSLTVLIEFQAYVLLLFGALLLGRAWMRPARVGAASRRQGYARGLRAFGVLALSALALFAVGAVYEAAEIYLLVPLVLGA